MSLSEAWMQSQRGRIQLGQPHPIQCPPGHGEQLSPAPLCPFKQITQSILEPLGTFPAGWEVFQLLL